MSKLTIIPYTYYLGIFSNNEIKVSQRSFLLSDDEQAGQFISSNWYKQKIVLENPIFLSIIKSNDKKEMVNMLSNLQTINSTDEYLHYLEQNPDLFAGNFLITKSLLDQQVIQPNKDKRITIKNYNPLLFNNSTLSINVRKNNNNHHFIFCPSFQL